MSGGGASRRPVRIANCSGFFGDRLAAAREMVEGGPVDVLTGDWLAELTMLILARQRMKHGAGAGHARTFLTQMEQVLGTCLDRGIRVVTNAGGLDPAGCAAALRAKADELGLGRVRIAVVEGDDLAPRLEELGAVGETFTNLDTGESLADAGAHPITANAYLGGGAVSAALAAGADVVITGRITDAALVIGPAAWWHDWSYAAAAAGDQAMLDALAGAVVAGHVIECGAQATGGNYAFFADVPGLEHPGFPIAEVAADGSAVVTKHDATGGMVTVGTVTAQLLYEIGGPAYTNPDVVARFDTLRLQQIGRDRVRISGARGTAAPQRLKVSMNYLGGFRNTATLVLTGLDVEAKADLALRTVAGLSLADCTASGTAPNDLGPRSRFGVRELHVELHRYDRPDPARLDEAQALLRITAKDPDPAKVGKRFTAPIVESALASYPGMFPTAPPADGTPYGVYWPTTVAREHVPVTVTLDGEPVPYAEPTSSSLSTAGAGEVGRDDGLPRTPPADVGADGAGLTVPIALGSLLGARSGDKGGAANVGVWVPDPVEPEAVALAWGEVDVLLTPVVDGDHDTAAVWAADAAIDADPEAVVRADAAYAWLAGWLTPERVHQLLPETQQLPVEVHPLPNLRAVNVVVHGLLGRGVADSTRLDPQAKGLGEHLRARVVEVPVDLLERAEPQREPA